MSWFLAFVVIVVLLLLISGLGSNTRATARAARDTRGVTVRELRALNPSEPLGREVVLLRGIAIVMLLIAGLFVLMLL